MYHPHTLVSASKMENLRKGSAANQASACVCCRHSLWDTPLQPPLFNVFGSGDDKVCRRHPTGYCSPAI
jgi:hypothetical protein